jgi:PAS domain S-box-containing protein
MLQYLQKVQKNYFMITIPMPEIIAQPAPAGVEESCDMLIGIDPFGKVTFLKYINPAARALFGYGEQEVIGEQVTDFIIGADNVTVAEHFGRLYASEDAFRAPNRNLKMKDGSMSAAETYVVPSYDAAGKFIGHYGMVFLKGLAVRPAVV